MSVSDIRLTISFDNVFLRIKISKTVLKIMLLDRVMLTQKGVRGALEVVLHHTWQVPKRSCLAPKLAP